MWSLRQLASKRVSGTTASRVSSYYKPYSTATLEEELPGLKKESRPLGIGEVKVTTLQNGLKIASVDNYAPISTVAMFFKAGTADDEVLSNVLRTNFWMSSHEKSQLIFKRTMEHLGQFHAVTYREHSKFTANVARDDVESSLDLFASACSSPMFMNWEYKDAIRDVLEAAKEGSDDVENSMMNDLHRVCFRGDLGNYVLPPTFRFHRKSIEDMSAFQKSRTAPNNSVLVGVGVDHAEFVSMAQNKFGSIAAVDDDLIKSEIAPSVFTGGREIRHDTDTSSARVTLGFNGPTLYTKEDTVASVLHNAIGGGPSIKWGNDNSKLSSEIGKVLDPSSYIVSTSNCSYTRGGLFVVDLATEGVQMDKLLNAAVKSVKNLKFTDSDLTRAKNILKVSVADLSSTSEGLCADIGKQVLLTGKYNDPVKAIAEIDRVTTNDIQNFVGKLTNPSMVVMGELNSTPFVSEL